MRTLLVLLTVLCGTAAAGAMAAYTEPEEAAASSVVNPTDEARANPVTIVVVATASPSPTPEPTPRAAPDPTPEAVAAPATAAPTPAPTVEPTLEPTPEPTLPPTPDPTPEPTPDPPDEPKDSYTRNEVKQAIRDVWPDGSEDKAISVARCESGLNPNARNGPYLGLWQFHRDTWQTWRYDGMSDDPRDHTPADQTRVALRLYSSRGWSPWGGCA